MSWLKKVFGRGSPGAPLGTDADVDTVEAAPRADFVTAGDSHLKRLADYLNSDGPADIMSFDREEHAERRARLYELLAEEPAGPVLTRYVLRSSEEETSRPYLIVSTGEMSEFEAESQYRMDAIRDRVLSEMSLEVGSWRDMGTASQYSNHSKPGLTVASRTGFDRLRDTVVQGAYALDRLITTAIEHQSEQVDGMFGSAVRPSPGQTSPAQYAVTI
jgi:hypothetical protein